MTSKITNAMKKFIVIEIALVVLLSCGTTIAVKIDNWVNQGNLANQDDSMLKILVDEKAKLIKEGKEVPKEMEEKIKAQFQKELDLREAEKKRQEYLEKLEKAPRDEKGNPILTDVKPLKKGFESFPKDSQVITNINYEDGDGRPSTVFGREITTSIITTMANCNFNIVASGCKRDNTEVGVIYNKIYSDTDFEVKYEKYEYPGKGIITLKSYEDDNNILIFSFGNDEEGYFDVRTKTAVFEKYDKDS